MKRYMLLLCVVAFVGLASATAQAAIYNGVADNETDSLGFYYVITGGKFVNGQTVNGLKTSGGAMAYTLDTSDWGSYPQKVWNKDGWFAQTAGLALTMKNGDTVVYDNFNNATGDFYTTPAGQATASTPGMYRGYSMSNNFDWIYAGYFTLSEATTITQITGYFDPNGNGSDPVPFNPASPYIAYRMNIWSNVDVNMGSYTQKTPLNTNGFDGDVFSSDRVSGVFTWGDTGVDRIYGADYGNKHDPNYYLTFTLTTPITLQAGEYWFSHDATIIPEPATIVVWSLLGLVAVGYGAWRRRRAA
jgi:hypothetical protein